MTTTANDTPDTKRREVQALAPVWKEARDVYAGTRALKANATDYLPKHPRERDGDYERRVKWAVLFNAYKRTIGATVGLIFARPPKLGDDVPGEIAAHLENVDSLGTRFDVWLRDRLTDALVTGAAGALVEYPATDGPVSLADQQRQNLRPYWVPVSAEQVLTWDVGRTADGRTVLTLLSIAEVVDERVGQFTVEQRKQVRVYRHAPDSGVVTCEVWRELNDGSGNKWVVVSDVALVGPSSIPYVPLVVGPATSPVTAAPPLLDLLDLNVMHFRVKAGRLHLMNLSCVPIPVRRGYVPPIAAEGQGNQPRVMGFGANVLQDLPAEGSFEWVEPKGTAFQPTREELQDLETQMAALGLAFLASDTRAAETAEAKRIDSVAQNATVVSVADALDDFAERCLAFHAEYMGLAVSTDSGAPSGGSFKSNRDFERTVLDPQTLNTLSEMQTRGQLSLSTLWRLMEQGNALPDGFDADAERADLQDDRDAANEEAERSMAAMMALRANAGTPAPSPDDSPDNSSDEP